MLALTRRALIVLVACLGFQLSVLFALVEPLPNDDVAGAETVKTDPGATSFRGSTLGASTDRIIPNGAGHSVWFKLTFRHRGSLVLSGQRLISVFEGTNATSMELAAQNIHHVSSPFGFPPPHSELGSTVSVEIKTGYAYWIAIDDFSNDFTAQESGEFLVGAMFYTDLGNDSFNSRLLFHPAQTSTFTSLYATLEESEPFPPTSGGTLWWEWQASSNGVAGFRGSPGVAISIFKGSQLVALERVAQTADWSDSQVAFRTEQGVKYCIRVEGGGHHRTLEFDSRPTAPNDDIGNAAQFTGLATVDVNSSLSTWEISEPGTGTRLGGRSLWWRWTAEKDQQESLATGNRDLATFLSVYTRTAARQLALVATKENLPGGEAVVTFDAKAGATYYFRIDWRPGENGRVNLELRRVRFAAPPQGFEGVVSVFNGGSIPTEQVRLRFIARSGYSATQNSVPNGPTPEISLTNIAIQTVPSGATITVTYAAPCPEPDSDSQNFARGWGVFVLLEELHGTLWVVLDRAHLGLSRWPSVAGYPGPGGGVVTQFPTLDAPEFARITLLSLTCDGPDSIEAGRSGMFTAIALFSNGSSSRLPAKWTASNYPIMGEGLLAVPQNAQGTIAVKGTVSFAGLSYETTKLVTIESLPALRWEGSTFFRGGLQMRLRCEEDRTVIIESAPTPTGPWAATSTNGVAGGIATVNVQTPGQKRFFRARLAN